MNQTHNQQLFVVIASILITVVVMAVWLHNQPRDSQTEPSTTIVDNSPSQFQPQPDPSQTPDTKDNEVTDLGGEGVLKGAPLDSGGLSHFVVLARTKDDFDAFVKANVASDKYGIHDLDNVGRIFTVPSGQVQAKKLDSTWTGSIQVRILSGSHESEAAWTYAECLQKQ